MSEQYFAKICACGNDPTVDQLAIVDTWQVSCLKCKIRTCIYYSRQEAVNAWNRMLLRTVHNEDNSAKKTEPIRQLCPRSNERDKERFYKKYFISKTDGTPFDNEAEYFIIRYDNSEAGKAALRRFAALTDDKELSHNLVMILDVLPPIIK